MKLRVVGWTWYDDDIEEGKQCWAARNAIVDDIKAHGYEFSGWAHQECERCAPILNDGKIYRFSQRGWGDVMAEAHGLTGRLDYTIYAFNWNGFYLDDEENDEEKEVYPQEDFDIDSFAPETDLSERFEVEVSSQIYETALQQGEIKLDDLAELRYLDGGDTLELRCGDKRAEYIVADVDRQKDLTEEERLKFEMAFYDFHNEQRRKHANEVFDSIKVVMIVKLSKVSKS